MEVDIGDSVIWSLIHTRHMGHTPSAEIRRVRDGLWVVLELFDYDRHGTTQAGAHIHQELMGMMAMVGGLR